MSKKKFSILKSFFATASILGLSLTTPTNATYAAAVSQMRGNVSLDNPTSNFDPPFVNGNTIEAVASGTIDVAGAANHTIGAIRLINGTNINVRVDPNDRMVIGSIAGDGTATIVLTQNASSIPLILNGNAGVDNLPTVNNYSALKAVTLSGSCTVTINAIPDEANTGQVNFAFTANSVLNIKDDNTTIRGAITNGANGTLNVNAGVTTATDPTITTIQETNIADNVTFNVDSINSDIDLLNNGTSIAFKGASSELDLINTGNADKQFTLYANLNPSDAEDEYGIVRIEATTNNLTIANNGGPYTIGQDNTHRLKELEVKGAGSIVIDNTIFTKRFNMNSTGQVTLNQILDLGADGAVLFNADGQLTLGNGITGDVTTAGDNTGILVVNAGNVTGAIGTNGGPMLKKVLFNGVSNVTTVDATTVTINDAAANVTAAGLITGAVSYTADGTLISNGGITGNVDFAGNEGVLQLDDGKTITGDVDSSGASAGTLEFSGNGVVSGNIGTTNAIAKISVGTGEVRLYVSGGSGVTIKAQNVNLTDTNSILTFYDGQITRFVGDINNTTGKANQGTLNVAYDNNNNTNTQITGNVGNTGSLAQVNIINRVATFNSNILNAANINLQSSTSTLNLGNGTHVTGNIDTTAGDGKGKLAFLAHGTVTGNVGANGTALEEVVFNGVDSIDGTANAINFTVANEASYVTVKGLISGAVGYVADGTLISNGGITGNVDFAGNEGVLQLADGKTITGDVDSSGASAGTLEFLGKGTVTGTIGATNMLTKLKFSGAGDSSISAANAQTIEVANAGANVTAAGLITGAVSYTADGTLISNGGITGDVTAANGGDGKVIVTAGNIANAGTNAAALAVVTFNNTAASNAGNIFATDVTVGNTGTDVTTGTVNGAIDFAADGKLTAGGLVTGTAVFNADGQLTLGNGITGDVTAANGGDGKVIVTAGNIANAGTNAAALAAVTFNNTAASNAGNIFATDVTVGNAGTDVTTGTVNGGIDFASAGKLAANGVVTGAAVFNADGQLTLGNGITGDVTTANGGDGTVIVNAGNIANAGTNAAALAAVTFNNTAASNAGNIFATDVTVGNAGTDVTTGTVNGGIDFASAGKLAANGVVTGAAVFNADGQLTLGNGITGDVTTANGGDGTVIVNAGNIANAGTNAAALAAVTFNNTAASNAGNIFATDVTVGNAGTDVTTGTVNGGIDFASAGKLAANGVVTGTAVFNADGQLTLGNGITGDVTAANGGDGKVIVTAGNIANAGTNAAALAAVTFNNTAASNAGNIFATDVTVGNAGTDVTTGTVNGGIDFASAGKLAANGVVTGTAVFNADGQLTLGNGITGDVTTANGGDGTVIVNAGNIANAGTNAAALAAVTFNNTAASNAGNIFATDVTVGNAGTDVTTGTVNGGIDFASAGKLAANGVVTGTAVFNADGQLTLGNGITGDVDFAGNEGILQLADGKTITGNVDSTTAPAGTLEFLGAGNVTGAIGATNLLTKLKFSGPGDSTIPAANAQTIEVANAGANVTASALLTSDVLFSADGSLVADKGIIGNVTFNDAGTLVTTGISGAIDCNSQAATINFSGDKAYILKTPIQNAENATLDVNLPKLTMINLEVGSINISDNKILAIDLASSDKTILAPGGNGIKFLGANSTFQIENTSNNDVRVASFAANLAGDVGGGGILLLSGGTQGLTITGDNAPTTIGVPGNEIAIVETQGIVTMQDSMDASSVSQLNIVSGSNFTDQSCSTAKIPNINIGTIAPTAYLNRLDDVEVLNNLSRSKAQLTVAGSMRISPPSAIYAIDVSNMAVQNLDILGLGQSINFIDENATVKLSNVSSGAGSNDRSITLLNDLDPGQDNFARVELSASAGSTLTIKGGLLGTEVHKLKQLELSGDGVLNIESTIHTTDLELNVPAITLADVHSNLSFATNTTLTAIGNIDGNIDFQNNVAIINIADGQKITGNVNSTGGNNGTINFEGKGAVDGVVTNLTMLKAGAGDVIFKTPGDYSITELQGNGSGIITFPSNMKYVGGMNITGGQPVNLNFANNNIINGNIGSSTSPVGNISSGANTEFNGNINSIGDIKTSGEALFAGNVACNNILANTNSSDALSSFSLFAPATTNVRNTINFDQDNVITKFQGTVHTKGGIKASGSTYFADTVNSQGNITINGDTKFNKTLSSGNNIDISHGSNVIFNGNVSANTINVNSSNIQVSDNISMAGNISASNSNIILDNNTLTLSGMHLFTNQLMINTTYDESSLSGGNIILASGSTLDLSNVSELTVKLSFINSDISKIADDTKYNIIMAEDGSNIVPLSDPEYQIILDSSGEQNKFVKWKLDVSSLTLYAYDDSNDVIDTDYVFDSVQDNMFMEALKHVTTNSDAEEFKNNIGLLDKEQAEEMLSRILDHPKERDSAIVQVALHQTLTDTNKVAMNAIHNRLSNTGLGMSQAAIAAGDDNACGCNDNIYEENRYGMWARSSINHSKDKVSGKNAEYFSSYKTKGHSNTIGLDSLICDNILLGIAYTNAYTSIRPKDQNIGNIDKVRTNMFSLYSAYNIPNYNWYLNSTISYAESSIRSGKIRYTAIAKNVLDSEVASGKYKSHLYSGSVSLGYNHYLGNNAYIVPSIGAIASLIRDKGYTETGTSFQNLTIRKKNYHKLSSIAGLRAYQDIYFRHLDNVGNASSLVVTPEAYGFVNYNIKNKSPATDARMQGIDERLPTINYRSNKVDYNLGLGLTIKHNMMEYGINYDANLAKKYQGHAGSIKVRVNL